MADPGDLPSLAAKVSADLTAAGIVHALSGSLSMAAYSRPRATLDAGFLVIAPAIRWPQIFAIARNHGFAGDDRECIVSMRERGHAMMRSGPVALDLLIPQIPFHHAIAKRAVKLRLEGVEVPFVTAEDLFVLKALWMRPKDVLDLEVMAEATRGTLDAEYVRDTLSGLLPPDDPRHEAVAKLLAPAT